MLGVDVVRSKKLLVQLLSVDERIPNLMLMLKDINMAIPSLKVKYLYSHQHHHTPLRLHRPP